MKESKAWLLVGVGCGTLILGTFAIAVGVFLWARSAMKQLESDLTDPAAQTRKAQSLLGCDRLPDGYPVAVALSVPFVIDMVVLSDRPPNTPARTTLGERGFIYTSVISTAGNERQQLRDMVEGRETGTPTLDQQKLQVETGETLHRGTFEAGGATIRYASQRGEIAHSRLRQTGLQTIFAIECPGDGRARFAAWFTPDVKGGDAAEPLGTPKDETAVRAFASQFRYCGR